MTQVPGEGHPVDVAVDGRVQHATERKQICQLQTEIMRRLAESADKYLALEDLVSSVQRKREKVYFDLGYEHGILERHARSRRSDGALPAQLDALGRELRERIAQQSLPPHQTVLVLLECAAAVIQRNARRR